MSKSPNEDSKTKEPQSPTEEIKSLIKESKPPTEELKDSTKVSKFPTEKIRRSDKVPKSLTEESKGRAKMPKSPMEALKGLTKVTKSSVDVPKILPKVQTCPMEEFKNLAKTLKSPSDMLKGLAQVRRSSAINEEIKKSSKMPKSSTDEQKGFNKVQKYSTTDFGDLADKQKAIPQDLKPLKSTPEFKELSEACTLEDGSTIENYEVQKHPIKLSSDVLEIGTEDGLSEIRQESDSVVFRKTNSSETIEKIEANRESKCNTLSNVEVKDIEISQNKRMRYLHA